MRVTTIQHVHVLQGHKSLTTTQGVASHSYPVAKHDNYLDVLTRVRTTL